MYRARWRTSARYVSRVLERDEVVDRRAETKSSLVCPSGPDAVDRDCELEGRKHVQQAGFSCDRARCSRVLDLPGAEQGAEIAGRGKVRVEQEPADEAGVAPVERDRELVGIAGDPAAAEVRALESLKVDDDGPAVMPTGRGSGLRRVLGRG